MIQMAEIFAISTPFDILAPPDLSASIIPSHPVEIETRKEVRLSQSEPGVRQSGVKSKSFRFYTLEFRGRQRSEFGTFQPLWEETYPAWTFEWVNPVFDASGEFYVDSAVKWVPRRQNLVDYSVVLRQKLPIATSVPDSNALPYSPDYGSEGSPTKQVVVSDAPDMTRQAAELSDVMWPFNLSFRSRYLAEALAMEQFWNYHYPGRPITYTDPTLGVAGNFWIDSNFKWRVLRNNLVEYSFAIREV